MEHTIQASSTEQSSRTTLTLTRTEPISPYARFASTILVVDDELEIVRVLSKGMAMFGYKVTTALSGEEALALLDHTGFDVLLTDIHMPNMHGDELQHRARAIDCDIVVILVTAATDIALAVECLQDGAYDFIQKPFDLKDVAVRVERALERRRLLQENLAYQMNLAQQVEEQAVRLQSVYQDSLQMLSHALEAKDECTCNHSDRVALVATALAQQLRPGDTRFQETLRMAATVHDIGKIGVPESILNKPGRLTTEEFDEIKKHPVIGEMILKPIFRGGDLLAMVRGHHERWDGGGYPDGLCGEQIPFGARLIAVADTLDALINVRPYRNGLSKDAALQILREGAGTQWDNQAVGALIELASSGSLQGIYQDMTGEIDKIDMKIAA